MSLNGEKVLLTRSILLGVLMFTLTHPLLTIKPILPRQEWSILKNNISKNPRNYDKELVEEFLAKCCFNRDLDLLCEAYIFLCEISFKTSNQDQLKFYLESVTPLLPKVKNDILRRYLFREYIDFKTKSFWQDNEFQKLDSLQLEIIDTYTGMKVLHKNDSAVLYAVFRNMFNSSVNKGDHPSALYYYHQLEKIGPCRIFTKKKFAEYHLILKDTATAFNIYRATLADHIRNSPDKFNPELFDVILAFSNAQLVAGDIAGSSRTWDLLEIYTTDKEYNQYEKIFLKGKIYSALKKFELANSYLTKYIELSQKRWGKKKKESIEASMYLANNEKQLGLIRKALNTFHNALINSSIYFNSKDINTYPQKDQIIFKREVVSILKAKAQCFADLGLLTNAIKSNELAIEIIQDLQSNYQNDEEISDSNNQYKLVYEDQLEYIYSLYSVANNDITLTEKAQSVFERSKNSVLLKSFRNSNAMVFADIPDSLIQKETRLKNELTNLDKGLRKGEIIDDTRQSEILLSRIKRIKIQYNQLIADFKINYPKYFNLKYNNSFANISDIKILIQNSDKSVIQYFVGKDYVYSLVVTATNQKFYRLLKSEILSQKIDTLISGMNLFAENENKYYKSGQKEAYSATAYSLYKELIHPLKPSFKCKGELVLIVDGTLGYIPFDVLLTKIVEPDKLNKYKFYPYLLKDYAISYNTSATLWKEMEQYKTAGDKISWVGFAPEYSSTGRDAPVGLKNSAVEIDKIASETRGSKFVGEDASKHNFVDVLNKPSLVQFAGHCVINDIDADSSFLAFTNEGKGAEAWKLSVNEIYGIHVNAKYLVLSACETGTGILKKGEGIMSLSRAFAYAGASSILSTLWKVDDKYSYALMSGLYKNLDKGLSKDKALRQAKLDFIAEGSNASAHPFNWGPFATLGNTQGITLKKLPKDYTLYYILIPAFLIVSFFGYRLYKRTTF